MKNINQKAPAPATGIKLGDLIFALFKHKWIILICSLLGFGGAGALYFTQKPTYQSRAKLMVRYVIERSGVDPYESKQDVGGRRGDSIMGAEVAIVTSWDLAVETAKTVGAERLVTGEDGKDGEKQSSESLAAANILKNLEVNVTRGSNVLNVAYSNDDPALAREVLQAYVNRYFEKHLEIHRSTDAYDFVTQQSDQARSLLRRTEDDLMAKKKEGGIISLTEATISFEAQRSLINSQLWSANAELAEQIARVNAIEAALGVEKTIDPRAKEESPANAGPGDAVDPALAPAAPDVADDSPDQPESSEIAAAQLPPAPSVHVMNEYNTLNRRIGTLEQEQFVLRSKFKESRIADLNQQEIARLKGQLNTLLDKYPTLVETVNRVGNVAGQPAVVAGPDLVSERARLAAIQARVKMLESQLAQVLGRFDTLTTLGPEIESLERQRKIASDNFQYFESSLEKAKVDEALDPTKMPNISYIQKPSAAAITYSPTTHKLAAGLAVVGVGLGVGLAFLLEFVVDRRVKRPVEIETRLRIPLMISIPRLVQSGRAKRLALRAAESQNGKQAVKVAKEATEAAVAPSVPGKEPHPLQGIHFINPYADAVRDRLGYYFELNNMTHKPKLIALTGLSTGAGTSTLAAGLAASFSEIDNAKVLFVDMNPRPRGDGGAEGEDPTKALLESLRTGRDAELGRPSDNLHVATVPTRGGKNGLKAFGPRKFYDLMPKFRASDFDYIIFDMPPLGPTSPTVAMAGFMDQVILVLDAQHTDRDLLQQGYADLARGSADVTCIFNKARTHAPKWIESAA